MKFMRISEIHIYRHDLPVVGGVFRTSQTSMTSYDTTIIEMVTENGLVGYGETCPHGTVYQPHHAAGARAALHDIAPHLVGLNALGIDCVRDAMDKALAGHRYAKAAVDIALWDLSGKFYGARVCDLLGGAKQETVPSYFSIGVTEPEAAASIAREKQAEGYRRLQLKVGGRDTGIDIEGIRKVHETLKPGVRLAVDVNRGWTTRDAVMVSQACRDLPFTIEQPCDTVEEIASLRGRVSHAIFLDESTEGLGAVLHAVGQRMCDGFSLKVTRLGGISTMRTIRDVCRTANLPMTCDDAWGGDIIAAACTHIGATVSPRLLEGVWLAAPYIDRHYDPKNGIRIERGHIRVPGGPGLGVQPDSTIWGPPVASFGG